MELGKHAVLRNRFGNYQYVGEPKNTNRDKELGGFSTPEQAVEAYRRFDKFAADMRVDKSRFCICPLLGRRHTANYFCVNTPKEDHPRLFTNKKTKERIFIHQPYFGQEDTIEDITSQSQKFAQEHGLVVRVSVEDSWWFPGRTVLVEYRRQIS